jgi:cysteine-rich repeat protein
MRTAHTVSFALAAGMFGGCLQMESSEQELVSRLSGAIFTSVADGSRVNANIYASKADVYLDGGPGPQAPSGAAALPAGDYYFQVTDPSGKTLLSTDAIECRQFTVSGDGVIVAAYSGTCGHLTGIDQDHADLGAITVQLMPYLDTPNPGGEYKVWVTPVSEYSPGDGRHGFVNRYSKTDNFKVREIVVAPPPEEPKPCCGDGHLDPGEECDDGNLVDGDGCSSTCTLEPPPPAPCCGDGHVDPGEECDDGNLDNGDGCSSECLLEPLPPPPPHDEDC